MCSNYYLFSFNYISFYHFISCSRIFPGYIHLPINKNVIYLLIVTDQLYQFQNYDNSIEKFAPLIYSQTTNSSIL